jgi:hypothetical protein
MVSIYGIREHYPNYFMERSDKINL